MSYADDIQKLCHLSINEIVRISRCYVPDRFKSCPWGYEDGQGRGLNHGTAVLETEEQCLPICQRMDLCIVISLCVH